MRQADHSGGAMRGAAIVAGLELFDSGGADAAQCQPAERCAAGNAKTDNGDCS